MDKLATLRNFTWLAGAPNAHGLAELAPCNHLETTSPEHCQISINIDVVGNSGDVESFLRNVTVGVREIADPQWTSIPWQQIGPNPEGDGTRLMAIVSHVVSRNGIWYATLLNNGTQMSDERLQLLVVPPVTPSEPGT